MQSLSAWRKDHGHWAARRRAQSVHWFEEAVRSGLLARLTTDPQTQAQMQALSQDVSDNTLTPDAAASRLLATLR